MVKAYLKDGGMSQFDGINAEDVEIDKDLGFLHIVDEKRNEAVLIPRDNIRFVQANRTANDEEGAQMELHNNVDNAFQMIHNAILNKAIKWNDFHSVGVEEDYHDWYYAENQLYVIHDRILDNLHLVRAGSPARAWESFQTEVAEIWGNTDA